MATKKQKEKEQNIALAIAKCLCFGFYISAKGFWDLGAELYFLFEQFQWQTDFLLLQLQMVRNFYEWVLLPFML